MRFALWSAIQEGLVQGKTALRSIGASLTSPRISNMALRLQVWGYVVRMAAWAGEASKKACPSQFMTSLQDWEKYAYGLQRAGVPIPVKYWLTKGPITPLFRRFLVSGMPIGSKINIISYIGTYYAIGAAWIMTPVELHCCWFVTMAF